MMKNILVSVVLFVSGVIASASTDFSTYDLAGHVTLKNDVPTPIQLTLFEGDFTRLERGSDYDALKGALSKQEISLLSEIFYSLKDGAPNLLLMIVKVKDVDSILILDLAKNERFVYNISKVEPTRLISSDPNYSDYILNIKK